MGLFTTIAIVAGSAVRPDVPHYLFLLVALAGYGGMAVHAVLYKAYMDRSEMKAGALFAASSLLVMTVCIMVKIPSLFAALIFIGYWMMIGWLAQREGWIRLISLSIVMIALRIFGVYVELFGGLMTTGFGLILGGLVMLGLIYASRKLNRRLTQSVGGAA